MGFINAIIFILVCLAIIGSIAAWLNTKAILEDLSLIKKELGIQEEEKKPRSIIDDDLDIDDRDK
ncbi:hypothetical protein ACM26V_19625 [Salipaludibacillus sp. HK11]|uniref:hypothetical protein n=1 Tax=Salipaludibacillus sp. HK11 TaxID=3394320 RepID=UPI0039FDAC3F